MLRRFRLWRCVCWSVLEFGAGTVSNPPSLAQINAAAATPETAPPPFGAPAEKLTLPGVPRAGKISDVLFRGAQPSAQGLAELKKLGITTIVNLRGNRGPVALERRQAESLGMRFIDIPVLGWSAPTNPPA